MSYNVIGTCSLCGGMVAVPKSWMGMFPPIPRCQSCGATREQPHGPIINMTKDNLWKKGEN